MQNARPKHESLWLRLWIFGAAALCWLTLWNTIRIDWETNAQYAFGWSSPFTAIALLVMCWGNRPSPKALGPLTRRLAAIALTGVILLHLPLRFVEEANPEWRMLYWIRAAQCVAFSFGWLAFAGGLPWVRHFAFPILFPLTAVPWPRGLEDAAIQRLTQTVSAATVELLFWINIPALRFGNLIQLANETVGLSEACSGIRSLQTSLMLALLAGEFWNLKRADRFRLIAFAFLAAFTSNLARTFSLCILTANGGRPLFDRWHDPVGSIEMAGCVAIIFLAAWLFRGPEVTVRRKGPAMELHQIPRSIPAMVVAVWAVGGGLTEIWYRLHDARSVTKQQWEIKEPAGGDDTAFRLRQVAIPEATRAHLRTNDGVMLVWNHPSGTVWNVVFLRWPRGLSSVAAVTVHHPDVCLPAHGFVYDGEARPVDLRVKGIPMAFRHYVFNSQTEPVHAFFSLCDLDTSPRAPGQSDLTLRNRIASALAGRRNTRQAIVELIVAGAGNGEVAVQELRQVLERLVVVSAE